MPETISLLPNYEAIREMADDRLRLQVALSVASVSPQVTERVRDVLACVNIILCSCEAVSDLDALKETLSDCIAALR